VKVFFENLKAIIEAKGERIAGGRVKRRSERRITEFFETITDGVVQEVFV